ELGNILTEAAHRGIAARTQVMQVGPRDVQGLRIGQAASGEVASQRVISPRLSYWCGGRRMFRQGFKERCRIMAGLSMAFACIFVRVIGAERVAVEFVTGGIIYDSRG